MGADESKVTPPFCHKITAHKLKVGDHIYRRFKAVLFDHHGVVIEIKNKIKISDKKRKIKVIEMTPNGIQISTLSDFLAGYSCRLVYYNTPKLYETFQRWGTCHSEPAAPIEEIKQRIEHAKTLMNHPNVHVYNVFGANCEEFATWIKTGLYKGARMSQLEGVEITGYHVWNSAKEAGNSAIANGMSSAFKVVAKAATNTVDDVATQGVKTAGTEIVENTAKAAAKGMVAGFGIAIGIEVILSGWRVVKYCRDPTYLWCDLKRDCVRSWITSIVCAAVGVSSLAIGWWAILPAAGAGLLLALIFHFGKVFDGKSHKQKVYIEYKLNRDSSVDDLKKVRRRLKKKIKNEKLHPDMWIRDTSARKWWEKIFKGKKAKKLDKFMFLTSVREMLHEDIKRGYVLFDGDVPSEPRGPLAIAWR